MMFGYRTSVFPESREGSRIVFPSSRLRAWIQVLRALPPSTHHPWSSRPLHPHTTTRRIFVLRFPILFRFSRSLFLRHPAIRPLLPRPFCDVHRSQHNPNCIHPHVHPAIHPLNTRIAAHIHIQQYSIRRPYMPNSFFILFFRIRPTLCTILYVCSRLFHPFMDFQALSYAYKSCCCTFFPPHYC